MRASFDEGHALIVGVGGADDLPDTVTDAKGLARILTDPGRCAYPKGQVNLLTGERAHRDAVLAGLDRLANLNADSSVIIYFSGHGYRVPRGKKASYYLMPNGYDVDDLKGTAISGEEFADKLGKINAKRMLVLLDCCHAGGFDGAQRLTKAADKMVFKKSALPAAATKLFAAKQGRVLIASSKDNEVSYPGKPYSAFTTALIAALCGEGAAKEDGYVRVVDLALYTREAVVRLTEYQQTLQHPTMDFEQADNFVVAYYAGGAPKTKGLPAAIAKPQIETKPGSQDYTTFGRQTWNAIQTEVTNIQIKNENRITNMRDKITNTRRDTKIVHGDSTEVRVKNNQGFMMWGVKANTINNIQGQPPARPKRRR